MLSIKNHRLVGEKVTFRQTPNIGAALAPRYLVLHYTAGSSAASWTLLAALEPWLTTWIS